MVKFIRLAFKAAISRHILSICMSLSKSDAEEAANVLHKATLEISAYHFTQSSPSPQVASIRSELKLATRMILSSNILAFLLASFLLVSVQGLNDVDVSQLHITEGTTSTITPESGESLCQSEFPMAHLADLNFLSSHMDESIFTMFEEQNGVPATSDGLLDDSKLLVQSSDGADGDWVATRFVDANDAVTEDNSEFGGLVQNPVVQLPSPGEIRALCLEDTDTKSTSGIKANAAAFGDPHIKTWDGDQYDFHGECDLVLLQAPHFDDFLGLHLHIRTKIQTWWSYIESAVLQIGRDTLEVTGSTTKNHEHWINGKQGGDLKNGILPETLSGSRIHYRAVNAHQCIFRVDLGQADSISIEVYKKFVRVSVTTGKNPDRFAGSLGLMGAFPSGERIGRKKSTTVADVNAFAQEWQTRGDEARLFHAPGSVQYPAKCIMPKQTMRTSRRLGEALISREEAAKACANVSTFDKDACIFDVMATNDKGMAATY
ncbi:expressed unknown protein [Seminavis robusta]|uniref:VWFD domain-containing protein n=1 Tax=Seminavis robusta TaxID=568900 RepID=A0A9N8EBZ0_9STRA|nr:expressed unknown protein [Seminavis robusta]|eukprot:Sro946_g223340.1 n/a (489) ;mRNA; r:39605-41275